MPGPNVTSRKPTATKTTPTKSAAIAPSVVSAVASVLRSLGAPEPSGDPDEVFDRAARALGEPLLGIVVASRVPVGAYGLLEYGMRASATIGDALERLARHYASVSTRVRPEVSHIDGRSALLFHRRPGVRHSRHWIEMPAAAIAMRLMDGAGEPPLLHEVRFSHAEPAGALGARYVDAFRAPVRFRAKEDALVFSDGALRRPMSTGAAPVASSVDAELRAMEEAGEVEETFVDPLRVRIREALARRLDEGPTMTSIARELRLAPRTLQRHLADRGSSWSHELDEARRARALVLLAEPDRKTSDVAAALGFSDASAFFRAFRRWTGTTPRGDNPRD